MYRFEYPVACDKPDGKPWETLIQHESAIHFERSFVEVSVSNRAIHVSLVEQVRRFGGKGKKFTSQTEVWIKDETYFYWDMILPGHGTYILVYPKNALGILSKEMIYALKDGDLSLKIAQNAVNILLPLMCERSPDVKRIITHLKPIWMEDKIPRKPKRRSS